MKTGPKGRSGSTQKGAKPRGPAKPGGPRKPQGQGRPQGGAPKSPARPKPAIQRPLIVPHSPDTETIAGRNAVREALRAGKRVRTLFVPRESIGEPWVQEAIRLAGERRIPVEEIDRQKMDVMALDHQGLVAVVSLYQYAAWGELLERLKKSQRPPVVLLLDTLHDPQNFGTLLRTADALGVDGVVLPRHRSVHVTPSVVRASAGAVEHLVVPVVSNLSKAIEDLKEIGFWIAGLDVAGDRQYWELDMTGPMAIVLGGEDHGIGRLVKEKCDFLVKLPMSGHVNSLNAATAGSVVLYEMARQRLLKASTALD